jgi:hypothetical protein
MALHRLARTALLTSAAALVLPAGATAKPVAGGEYRGVSATGTPAKLVVSKSGKRVMFEYAIVLERLQCTTLPGASDPVFFGAAVTQPTTIRRTGTFRSEWRDTETVQGGSFSARNDWLSIYSGRFSRDGRTVTGTFQETKVATLISGGPTPTSEPALGQCTTGVVNFTLKLKRKPKPTRRRG